VLVVFIVFIAYLLFAVLSPLVRVLMLLRQIRGMPARFSTRKASSVIHLLGYPCLSSGTHPVSHISLLPICKQYLKAVMHVKHHRADAAR
jgi:hypothetical protein